MGFRSPIHTLDLPDYADKDDPANSLVVRVVAPSVREASELNAGRRTKEDGFAEDETSAAYQRRAFRYLAPKIRFWNLEDEDGTPVPIPLLAPAVTLAPEEGTDTRLTRMVDHLYDQDENIILAIYHAWRMVSLPKKADTDEGKDSGAPSTPGPSASPRSGEEWDLRELESQIPM